MEVKSINGSERSRSGLRATTTEKVEFRKTQENPQREFEQHLWSEVERYMAETALKPIRPRLEMEEEKPIKPRFESDSILDIHV